MLNVILIGLIMIASAVILYLKFFRRYHYHADVTDDSEKFTIQYLTEGIRDTFDSILKTDYTEFNMNREDTERSRRVKETLRSSLKKCTHGNLGAKMFVIDYVKKLLQEKYSITEESINRVIPFDNPEELNSEYKFMILLHMYKKRFDVSALDEFISRRHLDRPIGDGSRVHYCITCADINYEFDWHREVYDKFDFSDKVAILAQKIYQGYKGLGVIDDIRFQKIDGINCGTSGIPITFYSYGEDVRFGAKDGELPLAAFNAVWLMYHGKKIRLAFIGFEREAELERVVKNACRYNNAGTLSRVRGYIVNTTEDGCRVVGARPEMSESWVLFIRKFDTAAKMTLQMLYPFEKVENLVELLKYVITGCRNTALTGQQATGKTTCLMSIIGNVPDAYSIRVQEMAFELYLRKIYPERNIVTFQDTANVSAQEGIELQKKSDGDINLFGEVAQAAVVPLAIKLGQTGSAMLIFTSHHKTTEDLIKEWRDSLVSEGAATDSKMAEETVAKVLNFDIHLERSVEGVRYIQRVTEILPHIAEPYSDDLTEATIQFFYRTTDRQVFDTQDLIIWDNGVYRFVNDMSEDSAMEIRKKLSPTQQAEFQIFLDAMHAEVIKNRREGYTGFSTQDLARKIYYGTCVDEGGSVLGAITPNALDMSGVRDTLDREKLENADSLVDQMEIMFVGQTKANNAGKSAPFV